jgi:hypothetical protein
MEEAGEGDRVPESESGRWSGRCKCRFSARVVIEVTGGQEQLSKLLILALLPAIESNTDSLCFPGMDVDETAFWFHGHLGN